MISEAVIAKLLKFILIGMGGTVLDFTTTYLLKEKAKINKYVANSIGYTVAASSNFIFNRIWAFKNTNSHVITQYFTFLGISLVGLLIMNSFIWIFNEKLKFNFYGSKVIGLFIVLIWTFLAHYFITFSES